MFIAIAMFFFLFFMEVRLKRRNETHTFHRYKMIYLCIYFQNPPLRDTVIVPNLGYMVLRYIFIIVHSWLGSINLGALIINKIGIISSLVSRFRATNPGWFFAHCHLLLHNLGGMSFAFRVGTNEQMPIPPPNYPRHCGIYDGESDWNSVEKTQDHNSGKRFTQSWNLSLACLFFTILVYKCMFLK